MSEKSIALVILGIVAIVVIAGFVLLSMDNNIAKNEPISGLYSEYTISSDYQESYLGGRGRRYIEDAG